MPMEHRLERIERTRAPVDRLDEGGTSGDGA